MNTKRLEAVVTCIAPGKLLSEYVFEEMGFVAIGRTPLQVAVQVLERSSTIAYFGDSRPQVRGGLFYQNNCAAFGVLLAVGQVVKYVYTCWLNYNDDFDRQVFAALENQKLLMVRFYGSNLQMSRIYLLSNPLGDVVKLARAHLDKQSPWTLDLYRKVISGVALRCGHGLGLWQRLDSGITMIDLDALPA
jgi:hypothetical protein